MVEKETGPAIIKQEIRERVTKRLLEKGVVLPDPVFDLNLDHYIADFVGSEAATQRLSHLAEWRDAERIFITPDRSTQRAREIAIREGKEIVVTTYGIRRGAVLLQWHMVPSGQAAFAATLEGMEVFGKPLKAVDEIVSAGKIDLMVTGALAISTAHGGRTGKGAGWFDAEWIMWRKMGLTTPQTPVVGIVHDLQLVDEPFELDPWDAIVNTIVTPTQIYSTPARSQPEEILWERMDPKWLAAIPLMLELYERLNGKAYLPKRE